MGHLLHITQNAAIFQHILIVTSNFHAVNRTRMTLPMKKTAYTILANPISGRTGIAAKQVLLQKAAAILNARIHGLDTGSPEEFRQCARELAPHCDVLVVAGGDGTFSSVINAIDTAETTLAFLPLGTGNALRHAFGYRGDISDTAMQVKKGGLHHCDLIGCAQGKKAFMISIGIEAAILDQYRKQFLRSGQNGFLPYLKAALVSIFRKYNPVTTRIGIDGRTFPMDRLLSIMVMKQPFYGYGMKVVPQAKFDDRILHVLCSRFSWPGMILAGATAFTVGNRVGRYLPCRTVSVNLNIPRYLQMDGDVAWKADHFDFSILPGILRIRY